MVVWSNRDPGDLGQVPPLTCIRPMSVSSVLEEQIVYSIRNTFLSDSGLTLRTQATPVQVHF